MKIVKMLKQKLMAQPKPQYKRYTRSTAGNVIFSTCLILAGAFSVLPLIYCICASLKPMDELLVFPPTIFVKRPTLENFLALPTVLGSLGIPLSRYFFNSMLASLAGTILHILAASMAAFVFSKTKIRGKNVMFTIVQFALLYNGYTLAIPQYLIFSKMQIIDTYWVYILPAIPSAMGCFLMKQYIDVSIPDSLLEAARIDGAGPFKIYARVVMPIVKPVWMTLFLFSFRDQWSNISGGTIFSEQLKTLPQILSTITAGGIARMGTAMAATVLLLIPPVIVFMLSQASVLETMGHSGIKE